MILSDTYAGVFWWGKEKRTVKTVSVVENDVRTYRKKVKREARPREEWTAIPVPDSGIPPETVARARENIQRNVWNPSRNSDRTWELSGGIGVCGHCGSRLGTHTSSNAAKTKYFYYVCPKRVSNRDNGTCPNTKHYRAEALELLVKDTLEDAFRPETWGVYVDKICDLRLADLRRLGRSDPGKTKERLAARIGGLEMQLSRARELFIDGDLPRPDYEQKRATIQDEIEMVQEDLERVDDLDAEIRRVEVLRSTLMSIENPLSGHFAFVPDDPYEIDLTQNEDNVKYGFGYGSKKLAAKRRAEFYRQTAMRVEVGEKVEISLGVDRISVREIDRASGSIRSPTRTP